MTDNFDSFDWYEAVNQIGEKNWNELAGLSVAV